MDTLLPNATWSAVAGPLDGTVSYAPTCILFWQVTPLQLCLFPRSQPIESIRELQMVCRSPLITVLPALHVLTVFL